MRFFLTKSAFGAKIAPEGRDLILIFRISVFGFSRVLTPKMDLDDLPPRAMTSKKSFFSILYHTWSGPKKFLEFPGRLRADPSRLSNSHTSVIYIYVYVSSWTTFFWDRVCDLFQTKSAFGATISSLGSFSPAGVMVGCELQNICSQQRVRET